MAEKQNVYSIDSCRGGISDYSDKGIAGSFKFASNLDIRKEIDSISSGQALVDEGLRSSHSPSASVSPSSSVSESFSPSPSSTASPSVGESASPSTTPSLSASLSPSVTPSLSISPSPSPSGGAGVSTVFEDLIHFFVKCTDGYTYGFGNTGCIYRRDSDGVWQRVYKDTNGAILGAAEWYSDTGVTYLYWATAKRLNRKVIPGLSNWNDVNVGGVGTWPKTTLENATWHTMTEAGGSLIIANRTFLALVGYDDSFTNEAVNLIPGNEAVTLVERNGRSIVGTRRISDPTNGINASIDSEVPLAQVGTDGYIYYADMTNTMPIKRFPGGGQVNPGGVCNEVEQANFFEWEQNSLSWIDKQGVGNMALFGVYNATSGYNGIYSYGRRNKNHPFVLNLEYSLEADEIGALTNVSGTTLASYRDGTSYGIKAVDSTTKADGVYEGLDFRSPVKKPSSISIWHQAEIFTAPLPTGTRVEFWYRINKTGGFVQAYTGSDATSFGTESGKKAVFRIEREGEIIEPKLMTYSSGNTTPEVHRVRIFFS